MLKKELKLEEIKQISLEGLDFVDRICKENDLNYCLAFGTLLGAVRHKGFIPWDDDIDIWMTRDNYNKFIKIVEKMDDKNWEILSHNNKGYYFKWAKICNKKTVLEPSRFFSGLKYGISIDIFPIEPITAYSFMDAFAKTMKIYRNQLLYSSIIRASTNGIVGNKLIFTIKKVYFKFITLFINYHNVLSKLENDMNKKVVGDYNYYVTPFCSFFLIFSKNEMENFEYTTFEGNEYPISKDYDKILERIYGNYMKLPPKDKRVTNHTYKAYYKDIE